MEWVRIALVVVPMLVGTGAAIGLLMWTKRSRLGGRRSPLTQGLLRPAGHSAQVKWNDSFVDIFGWLAVLQIFPGMCAALFMVTAQTKDGQLEWHRGWLYLFVALAVIALASSRIVKIYREAMAWRMGWDAEVASGQELDQLMRRGAHVFHDLPAADFNVDHVLVCAAGVFSIETKSRLKPPRGDKNGGKVIYDGISLKFPGWVETAPLEQARRQARWLGEDLSKAVGARIPVTPVLALPGWYVEAVGRSDVRVLNPKGFRFLLDTKGDVLSDDVIGRVAYQLDQRCRNIDAAFSGKGDA